MVKRSGLSIAFLRRLTYTLVAVLVLLVAQSAMVYGRVVHALASLNAPSAIVRGINNILTGQLMIGAFTVLICTVIVGGIYFHEHYRKVKQNTKLRNMLQNLDLVSIIASKYEYTKREKV